MFQYGAVVVTTMWILGRWEIKQPFSSKNIGAQYKGSIDFHILQVVQGSKSEGTDKFSPSTIDLGIFLQKIRDMNLFEIQSLDSPRLF